MYSQWVQQPGPCDLAPRVELLSQDPSPRSVTEFSKAMSQSAQRHKLRRCQMGRGKWPVEDMCVIMPQGSSNYDTKRKKTGRRKCVANRMETPEREKTHSPWKVHRREGRPWPSSGPTEARFQWNSCPGIPMRSRISFSLMWTLTKSSPMLLLAWVRAILFLI